jgi:hypothetical protein
VLDRLPSGIAYDAVEGLAMEGSERLAKRPQIALKLLA